MSKEILESDVYVKHLVSRNYNMNVDNVKVVSRHMVTVVQQYGIEACSAFLYLEYTKNNNAHFFFNHQGEGFNLSYLEDMNRLANVLLAKTDINLNRFHLITGAVNCPRNISIYKQICQEYAWHEFPLWFDDFWESFNINKIPNFEIDYNKKTKRILCYNSVPRLHRIASVCEMYKRNILDKVYLSINLSQDQIDNMDKGSIKELSAIFENEASKEYLDILKQNKKDFPFKLTLTPDIQNAYKINKDDERLFKDSVVSLVNETVFSNKDPRKNRIMDQLTYPCTFATEKFWKTFQGTHPFIMLSTPHYLKGIRHLGYKTFSPYIDESYDDIEDDQLRFKKVMDEVERIANMTDDQVFNFQQQTKKTLEFNLKLMKTKKPTLVRVL